MSCCDRAADGASPWRGQPGAEPVVFEYRGDRPLTLFGRITGIRYRFQAAGERLRVDPRDASALDLVPALERVASDPAQA